MTDHDARKDPLDLDPLPPQEAKWYRVLLALFLRKRNQIDERTAKAQEAGRKARGEK